MRDRDVFFVGSETLRDSTVNLVTVTICRILKCPTFSRQFPITVENGFVSNTDKEAFSVMHLFTLLV